jgi:enediyne biosynthesis protein E4
MRSLFFFAVLLACGAGVFLALRGRGGKAASARQPAATPSLFEERAAPSGIDWRLGRARKDALTILEIMGAGCAVFDADGDGWDDIFLAGQEGFGHTGRSGLFRNRGDGKFQDVTDGSGLDAPGYYAGCATGDIDNDGRIDLFVSGYGTNRLFRNSGAPGGRPHFQDITVRAGVQARAPAEFNSAVAFGDFDSDGWADLYVGRYILFDKSVRQYCTFAGVQGSCPPWVYRPARGALYRNLRGRAFREVTREAGLGDQHGKTLGAVWADYNRDGRPDLYLANDQVAGDLYENQGGRFRNVAAVTGSAYNQTGTPQAGMGVDFADYNGDGWQDLVVTTFRQEPTSLYANRSGTLFDHRSLATGLDGPTRQWTGFGTRMVDFDNDGWPDLATANGHALDKETFVDKFSSYPQPMQLFMNQGGERFVDRSAEAGVGFTSPAVGRGLAAGDLDGDGRVDLVVTDLEGPARLLMNRIRTPHSWIGFRLRGSRSNRLGLGALVRVTAGGRTLAAECRTSGSYYSASSPTVHFGLGLAAGAVGAVIRWPSGHETVLKDLQLNRYHSVEEGGWPGP